MISKSVCTTFHLHQVRKAASMLSLPYLAVESSLPGRVSKMANDVVPEMILTVSHARLTHSRAHFTAHFTVHFTSYFLFASRPALKSRLCSFSQIFHDYRRSAWSTITLPKLTLQTVRSLKVCFQAMAVTLRVFWFLSGVSVVCGLLCIVTSPGSGVPGSVSLFFTVFH